MVQFESTENVGKTVLTFMILYQISLSAKETCRGEIRDTTGTLDYAQLMIGVYSSV